MKSFLLLTTCLLLFFAPTTQAQKIKYIHWKTKKPIPKVDLVLKGGVNFDNMNGLSWAKGYELGYNGGFAAGVRQRHFGFQIEGVFSSARYMPVANRNYIAVSEIQNIYFSVPLLFELKLVPRIWLVLGPQMSLLASSKYVKNDKSIQLFRPANYSVTGGLQFLLPLRLTLGARYVYGLTDMDALPIAEPWKTTSVHMYLGFRVFGY